MSLVNAESALLKKVEILSCKALYEADHGYSSEEGEKN